MEKERGEMGIEPIPEKTTDMEAALFLAKHIDNPCEGEVEPGRMENIRKFYIQEAERALNSMSNPDAKKLLEDKIREYKK